MWRVEIVAYCCDCGGNDGHRVLVVAYALCKYKLYSADHINNFWEFFCIENSSEMISFVHLLCMRIYSL